MDNPVNPQNTSKETILVQDSLLSTAVNYARPVAIVTGGKQGLGKNAALHLARKGFDVGIADLSPLDEGDPTINELMAELQDLGAKARYYQLDISDVTSHQPFVDQVWDDFGRLDCLHNNAGIAARPLTDVLDLDTAIFDKAWDINGRGTFFLTQTVAASMLNDPARHTDGIYRSILFVTSVAASAAFTDRAQYCISKAATSMAAQVFAARLGSEGIHVHEVRPGFMQTAMTASAPTDLIESKIKDGTVSLGRWGAPDDVGKTVATLASGSLPYSTGQPFWVAGGLNIQRMS